MNIKIKSVKDVGSCNFCRRGRGDWEKLTNYPYTQVYEIEGNTIGFRMCEHCRKEFIDKILRLPLI
jgi:hypothetical protein